MTRWRIRSDRTNMFSSRASNTTQSQAKNVEKMAKITPGHMVRQLWIHDKTCVVIRLLDLIHTNPTFDLQNFKTYFNKFVSNTVLNSKQNVERALWSPCFKFLFVSLGGIQKLQIWNLKRKEAKSMQKEEKKGKRRKKDAKSRKERNETKYKCQRNGRNPGGESLIVSYRSLWSDPDRGTPWPPWQHCRGWRGSPRRACCSTPRPAQTPSQVLVSSWLGDEQTSTG